jgi:hypothetical protein
MLGLYDACHDISPPLSRCCVQLLLDIPKTPVAPKFVLPIKYQGPWESRRLWQFTTAELRKRPVVDWAKVDREKAQLEEEQRLIPCHLHKTGAAGYEDWATKKFHSKKVEDPLDGGEKEFFIFDHFNASSPRAEDTEINLLALSRSLPDIRGGLHGAGAVAEHVTAMKTVKLSAGRQESGWQKF